ncbi:hypothetical protein [Allohahella marinimesophila]|uniref:Energy-coupling factor ABC transporter permease n=1 Tax=Allohahella marinimesophila TaxID=1054972 RepID=A0ABP7NF94_9GAMM
MECLAQSSSPFWVGLQWSVFGIVLFFILANVRFRRFQNSEFLHMCCGALLAVLILWRIRYETDLGLAFHFLGISVLVLVFHWLYATVIGILACLIGPLIGVGRFETIPMTATFVVLIPVAVTLMFLKLERHMNRRLIESQVKGGQNGNFFLFIMLPGFLGAGFAIGASMLAAFTACWMLNDIAWSSNHSLLLAYLPLIMLPEGIINGMLVSGFVAFWPEKLNAFHEEDYS